MDSEVLHTRPCHARSMPREGFARASGAPWRQPALWAQSHAQDLGPSSVPGAYPRAFLPWALRVLQADASEVLHVCSGTLKRECGGLRVDVRESAAPDILADGRSLPFPDELFEAALIDPPYSVEYARDLYGSEYPRPSALLREAARVVRSGGRIGFVHFLVPMPPVSLDLVRVYGITTGCGYRIRALSLFRKHQAALPLGSRT